MLSDMDKKRLWKIYILISSTNGWLSDVWQMGLIKSKEEEEFLIEIDEEVSRFEKEHKDFLKTLPKDNDWEEWMNLFNNEKVREVIKDYLREKIKEKIYEISLILISSLNLN